MTAYTFFTYVAVSALLWGSVVYLSQKVDAWLEQRRTKTGKVT